MKTKSNIIRTLTAAGVLTLSSLTSIYAVPTITVTSGSSSVTIVDNGANDLNPSSGALAYTGQLGVFTFTLSTGITKPFAGTAAAPLFSLSENASASSAGTLLVSFSDTSFGPSSGVFNTTLGGGATAGSVNALFYKDTTNTLFGTSSLMSTLSGSGTQFAVVGTGGNAPASAYSLTESVTITALGAGLTTFTATTSVPDGGSTIALLGLTLISAECIRRLLNKRSAVSAI